MSIMNNRHHPITILYSLYHVIRNLIVPIALFIFNEIKADTGSQPNWVYIIAWIVGIFICTWSFVSWWKKTYHFDHEALYTKEGVLTVTERTIPLSKINSINLKQNWFYRLFGIVKLEVRTADSNANADAKIAVSKRTAKNLEALLNLSASNSVAKQTTGYQRTVTNIEILMMAISSNAFWLGVPFVGTLIQFVLPRVDPQTKTQDASVGTLLKEDAWNHVDIVGFVVMVVVALLFCAFLSWLVSLVIMQIKYKGWSVSRDRQLITIRFGLLDKKTVQIDARKIQSIRVKEKMLSRFFGYASIWIDCVGYEGENRSKILYPATKKENIAKIIEQLLPEFQMVDKLNPLEPKAKPYMVLPIAVLLVGILFASIFYRSCLFALPILIVAYAHKSYAFRHSGWALHGNQVILCKAGISKTTVYLLRKATESISQKETALQRLFGVHKVEIDIDSPSRQREYVLTGVNYEDVQNILHWYKNRKIGT